MKKSYLLYFIAAALFAIAAIIGFINNKAGANSIVAALLSISMVRSCIHYR